MKSSLQTWDSISLRQKSKQRKLGQKVAVMYSTHLTFPASLSQSLLSNWQLSKSACKDVRFLFTLKDLARPPLDFELAFLWFDVCSPSEISAQWSFSWKNSGFCWKLNVAGLEHVWKRQWENQRGAMSHVQREWKEGEWKKERKENPRPPGIVFYVTWLAADVIACD